MDPAEMRLPVADRRHVAKLFVIERVGTLLLLSGLLVAGPALWPSAAPWLMLALSTAGALIMRATLPAWSPALLRVRPPERYFGLNWPESAALAAPIGAVGLMALGPMRDLGRGCLFLALALLNLQALARVWQGERRVKEAPLPVPLPQEAHSLLRQAGLPGDQVRLATQQPDLLASIPFVYRSARRSVILLGPRMLAHLTAGELTAVIAHELGHLRLKHAAGTRFVRVCLVLFGGLVAAGAAWLAGDAATAVPAAFLAAALVETLAVPLEAAVSRRQERHANAWAMAHLGDAEAFVSMTHKVHDLLGRPAEPAWWYRLLFCDHPSLGETLSQAAGHAPPGNVVARASRP